MTYALVNLGLADAGGVRIEALFGSIPVRLKLTIPDAGDSYVEGFAVGWADHGFRFVAVTEVGFARPGLYYTKGEDVVTFPAGGVTITRQWIAWTQAEVDAYLAGRRDRAAEQFADPESVLRAFMLTVLEEFNRHAAVHREIIRAVAGATSLADLRSRVASYVAAVPGVPDAGVPNRSIDDLRAALRNKLGT